MTIRGASAGRAGSDRLLPGRPPFGPGLPGRQPGDAPQGWRSPRYRNRGGRSGAPDARKREPVDGTLHFIEGLALFRELGDRGGLVDGEEGFALLAAAGGQAERAVRLAGAAAALRVALNAPAAALWQAGGANSWLQVDSPRLANRARRRPGPLASRSAWSRLLRRRSSWHGVKPDGKGLLFTTTATILRFP